MRLCHGDSVPVGARPGTAASCPGRQGVCEEGRRVGVSNGQGNRPDQSHGVGLTTVPKQGRLSLAPTHAAIRSLFLDGPAGRLEALVNVGSPTATHAGLVCHPHPMFGGTMHNKVVFHAMKALHSFGFPVLRFNFRGTGLSSGEHDGKEEVADVAAALAWLKHEFALPIIFAGFSFGAAMGLKACCLDPDVRALISLGTPVEAEGRIYSYRFLHDCGKPKLFLSGDHDQFGPNE